MSILALIIGIFLIIAVPIAVILIFASMNASQDSKRLGNDEYSIYLKEHEE